MNKIDTTITDKDDSYPTKDVPLTVESVYDSILISAEGYGDKCGGKEIVLVEIWQGELRVVIWGDVNQEDPTHIISLEQAREELYKYG